ncbi:MAG TPA: hypothetical protein ENO14_00930 [Chromatiales bacterium]|nr:hypothetical protein [Chromatiales bacterium]
MGERLCVLGLAFVLCVDAGVAQATAAESPAPIGRENRVVVHSPHFDVPLPRWGGLSCPAGPLHLYGFEGAELESPPLLRVRVFIFDPTRTRDHVVVGEGRDGDAQVPVRAMVQLTRRIEVDGDVPLPAEPPWMELADETGLAVLAVPVGVYGIRFGHPGIGPDEGIIRVREAQGDSIRAYLIPGAICDG